MSMIKEESSSSIISNSLCVKDYPSIWVIENQYTTGEQVIQNEPSLASDLQGDYITSEKTTLNATRILMCEDILKLTQIEHKEEMHLCFFVRFDLIEFQNLKNEITFLQFGKTKKSKTQTFGLNTDHQLVIKYFTQDKKMGKMVSETLIHPNRNYFVCFSLYNTENYTEIVLTVDCQMQTSLSFSYPLYNFYHCTTMGSEVSSSNFWGNITDLMIVHDIWPAQSQVAYFENYMNCSDGSRCVRWINDMGLDKSPMSQIQEKMLYGEEMGNFI